MTQPVEFETSAWKVWLLALLGVPFLLIGADFFFQQKLIGVFRELIYGTEELPAFEPRDEIFAALFVVVGAALIGWGLKELVFPKKVLVADEQGIRLAVAGPFRPAVLVPWDALKDLSFEVFDSEGEPRSTIVIEVEEWAGLPEHPWGARWMSAGTMLIDTAGWSPPPDDIVDSLVRLRESFDAEKVE